MKTLSFISSIVLFSAVFCESQSTTYYSAPGLRDNRYRPQPNPYHPRPNPIPAPTPSPAPVPIPVPRPQPRPRPRPHPHPVGPPQPRPAPHYNPDYNSWSNRTSYYLPSPADVNYLLRSACCDSKIRPGYGDCNSLRLTWYAANCLTGFVRENPELSDNATNIVQTEVKEQATQEVPVQQHETK